MIFRVNSQFNFFYILLLCLFAKKVSTYGVMWGGFYKGRVWGGFPVLQGAGVRC